MASQPAYRTHTILISHRGNLHGPNPALENSRLAIDRALRAGFHVEVDVRWDVASGEWFLGHDANQYPVDEELLLDPRIWCHAKDHEALANLLEIGAHCFGHTNDPFVITSRGYVWTYPGYHHIPGFRGIIVLPEQVQEAPPQSLLEVAIGGVCTDYPFRYCEERHAADSDHTLQR